MASAPIYSTRVSAEVMAEQSRKATAEGMRDLATAMKKKQTLSDSDHYYSDSSSGAPERSKRRARHDNNSVHVHQLEQRLDVMRLEVANAKVDCEDTQRASATLKAQLAVYGRINNALALLKSSMMRMAVKPKDQTVEQLERRLTLFKEEIHEHGVQCQVAMLNLNQDEIKTSITRAIEADKRKSVVLATNLEWVIWRQKTYNYTLYTTFGMMVAVLLAMLCANLFNY